MMRPAVGYGLGNVETTLPGHGSIPCIGAADIPKETQP